MVKSIRDRVRQAVGRGGKDADDEQVDQLEARIEREQIEARREAKRELRKERLQQAREDAKSEVKEQGFSNESSRSRLGRVASAVGSAMDRVDDGDKDVFDDFQRAMQTDFDGDGEPFASEIGLQSRAEGDRNERTLVGLTNQVETNTSDINQLKTGRGGSGRRSGRTTRQRETAFGSDDADFGGGVFAPQNDDDPWGVDEDGGLF